LRRRPGGSATVGATSPRREPFIPQEQTPAGRTSGELAFAADSSRTRQSADAVAYRTAHRRLYEHLCATTKEGDQPTLEDLQPLYQAEAHGCQAGLQQEACERVYFARILRGNEFYSSMKLGAFGSDLGAAGCFFEIRWSRVSHALTEALQAWLLALASFNLRALGRLTDALEPMRAGLEMYVKQQNWKQAANVGTNLSNLNLTRGDVASAVRDAEQSVVFAGQSRDAFWLMGTLIYLGDGLHQAGRRAEAEARFREAERMQAKRQPDYPLLYSVAGFQYCDLLLAVPERAAWQALLLSSRREQAHSKKRSAACESGREDQSLLTSAATSIESCRAVSQRAATALQIVLNGSRNLLEIGLNHLTLGRAALYEAVLESRSRRRESAQTSPSSPSGLSEEDQRGLTSAATQLAAAVDGLRRAGDTTYLPCGLLTRAWLRSLTAVRTGPESAQSDLDEAWEIAERGSMRLFLADSHLYRARLFGTRNAEFGVRNEGPAYPWDSPQADLAAAEKLINECGYHRRDEELADAQKAILGA
jgi:hypothetical protein